MPAFQYNQAVLTALEDSLSKERLATYLNHAQQNNPAATLEDALDLYIWNLRVSGALQAPIHVLEVALRNALHLNLTMAFKNVWIDDPQFIHVCVTAQYPQPQPGQSYIPQGPDLLKDIHKVRNRIAKSLARKNAQAAKKKLPIAKNAPSVHDVVAGLDFGFWTTMLDEKFEQSLWRPILHHAFPHYSTRTGNPLERKPISARFNNLRDLRNRVMHHEPLFYRNVAQDFQDISDAISWMYDDVAPWVDHHSRWPLIQATQANRPETF